MIDLSKELEDFKNAVYGEDIRDSMVSAMNKLNEAVTPTTKEDVERWGFAKNVSDTLLLSTLREVFEND